jgi:hypothetical protein
VFVIRKVRIVRRFRSVEAGAVAFPTHGRIVIRVRSRRTARVTIGYGAIVNPSAKALPHPVLEVLGDPNDPAAILLRAAGRRPRLGTIFVSGPGSSLPSGLLSRVVRVTRQGALLEVSLVAVPIEDAVPQLAYSGDVPMTLTSASLGAIGFARTRGGFSPDLRAESQNCASPRLLDFSAHLDSVDVRQAFLGAWPPQMRLTLAVRTTESLGVSLATGEINCSFDLGGVGPFQGEIPVGPVVIPVYATFPVTAAIDVQGSLNAGSFNFASTTVAQVAAGFDQNSASLSEQGSNVWISGAPSLSGSADLSASIGVEAGIGIAKGANVHLAADFGPEFTWNSGQGCDIDVNLGSLSAGVDVFGKSLNTPPYTPFQLHLWKGCTPAVAGSPGTASGGGSPSPPASGGGGVSTGGVTGNGGTGSGGGTTVPAGATPETVGGITNTWTDYSDAGGSQGPSIPGGQTVGVTCKVQGFQVADGNTWWYQIASSPWNNAYYASADAFYNNGQTSGSLVGTPFVDNNVPNCGTSAPPPPPPTTYAETVGSVTHTWTDYSDAGGTQGPSIQNGQTVQVTCKVQGFQVADGDTWWYQIATSPWSNVYYASADAFYNNGQTSGSLVGTPFVDNNVPNC